MNPAAVDPDDTLGFAKVVEVAAYGLESYAKMSCQILHRDPSGQSQKLNDTGLPVVSGTRNRYGHCTLCPIVT